MGDALAGDSGSESEVLEYYPDPLRALTGFAFVSGLVLVDLWILSADTLHLPLIEAGAATSGISTVLRGFFLFGLVFFGYMGGWLCVVMLRRLPIVRMDADGIVLRSALRTWRASWSDVVAVTPVEYRGKEPPDPQAGPLRTWFAVGSFELVDRRGRRAAVPVLVFHSMADARALRAKVARRVAASSGG